MLTQPDLYASDVRAGLEALIASQEERDTLAQAVTGILRDWLTERGYMSCDGVPPGEPDPDA